MVALLALGIELWVFPPDLISIWPTLGTQEVGFPDLRKIAVIDTDGVTTGALAGGLQRRRILRNMALYQAGV